MAGISSFVIVPELVSVLHSRPLRPPPTPGFHWCLLMCGRYENKYTGSWSTLEQAQSKFSKWTFPTPMVCCEEKCGEWEANIPEIQSSSRNTVKLAKSRGMSSKHYRTDGLSRYDSCQHFEVEQILLQSLLWDGSPETSSFHFPSLIPVTVLRGVSVRMVMNMHPCQPRILMFFRCADIDPSKTYGKHWRNISNN